MSSKVNWLKFVEALLPEWENNDTTRELDNLVKYEDIKKAVWGCLRSDSVVWINSPVPMLDGCRPIDLIETEDGRDKVRWILMSNPWW